MFTGLVETQAQVRRTLAKGKGLRIWVAIPTGFEARTGESVCISGACLTIAGKESGTLRFDLSGETLVRTWFSSLRAGDALNLERAMRLSDRLDGHLVTGHVDGGGRIVSIEDPGDGGRRMSIEADRGLERYLIDKGSITVDGVSLTVVEPRARRFDVALIPVTLERTTLGRAEPGQRVNLEADLVGKWIERLLAPPRSGSRPPSAGSRAPPAGLRPAPVRRPRRTRK